VDCVNPGEVLINEVAWAGSNASPSDEWIELLNLTSSRLTLDGWRLIDNDDIEARLSGALEPFSYYLMERSDDSTISNIAADHIYSGSLHNNGERLRLLDACGEVIDRANQSAGSWPGGDSGRHASMERWGGDDRPGNWGTYTGVGGVGVDASGDPIQGTPKEHNSVFSPQFTSTPSPTIEPSPEPPPTSYPPLTVLINEVAWAGTFASASDEWMELLNTSNLAIDLEGWLLTDGGDIQIQLSGTIAPRSFFLLERSDDRSVLSVAADQVYTGSLRNSGEHLQLLDPSGGLIDSADGSSSWPAGDAVGRESMERWGGFDRPGNWGTFNGLQGSDIDADGNRIPGTPRRINSILLGATPSPTAIPSTSPEPPTSGAVLINEIAWAGTRASASDEWIELLNTTLTAIPIDGWILSDGADIHVRLSGLIPAGGFYLLERTDDHTVSDMTANIVYTGSLNNGGERLMLSDPNGNLIDSANRHGGSWPGGDAESHASMERWGGADQSGSWGTFTGYFSSGRDAAGGWIQGTPGQPNSILFPTPTPTWIPGRIVVNEVLIRPHYDWEGTGGVNPKDEFIELMNRGPHPVNLRGWYLDDVPNGGSKPYELRNLVLEPGEFIAYFRTWTGIALNDTGDTVRVLAPDGRVIDSVSYLKVRAYNLSYGRLPDGSRHMRYGLWPTPNRENLLFVEPQPSMISACHSGDRPRPLLPRLNRSAMTLAWANTSGRIRCPPVPSDTAIQPPDLPIHIPPYTDTLSSVSEARLP
jgi:hypothetical protein